MKKENNTRSYPGESSRNRPDRAKQRRNEADERQNGHDNLTIEEKLAKLDAKFGEGIGAIKEREKLNKQSDKKKQAPAPIKANEQKLIIPEEVLAEIASMNEENPNKRVRAKDRRNEKNRFKDR